MEQERIATVRALLADAVRYEGGIKQGSGAHMSALMKLVGVLEPFVNDLVKEWDLELSELNSELLAARIAKVGADSEAQLQQERAVDAESTIAELRWDIYNLNETIFDLTYKGPTHD